MPVKRCKSGGKDGWQWGNQVCYTGKDAEKKAYIQGYVIQKSEERAGKSTASEQLKIDLFLREAEKQLASETLSEEFSAFADELIAADKGEN